jgi:hypothetical protein
VAGVAGMKRRKINHSKLLALVACSVFVTIGIVLLFFSFYAVFKVYDLEMSIIVSDKSGFNTDTDKVNFGKAMPGNSNSRVIVMEHDYGRPLLIHFKESGNISRFVQLPDDFYLEPGLSKEVTLSATVPKDAQKGYYEGRLKVYFRRI